MKKLVFGLLVAVSLVLSVGCAFATVDISQTHWQLPDRGFSGGSRVYPVDTVLTYTDLSALRNSLNDSMQSRSAQLTYSGVSISSPWFVTVIFIGFVTVMAVVIERQLKAQMNRLLPSTTSIRQSSTILPALHPALQVRLMFLLLGRKRNCLARFMKSCGLSMNGCKLPKTGSRKSTTT